MGGLTSKLPWRQARQEDIDVWRIYQLLYYRNHCDGKEVRLPSLKGNVPRQTQRIVVKEEVTKQVEELLNKISVNETSETTSSFTLSVLNPQDSYPVPGVRLNGHVVPGSVLCLHPGIIYSSSDVKKMENYPHISMDNSYLMSTSDGSIIDAKTYAVSDTKQYPFALGHLIRHPPSRQLPNVMPYTLHVPDTNIFQLIPNQFYSESSSQRTLLTIVLISMRHIKNEELFLNYRLHPKTHLPLWYTSLDKEEDIRRWKKIKHL